MMSESPKTNCVGDHLTQTDAPRKMAFALIQAYQLEHRPDLAQALGTDSSEPVLETVAAWIARELPCTPLALDGAVMNWLAFRLEEELKAQEATGHV
ncbi:MULTISPECIES: hypothetical protein [unclassified Thioalkalivibrio]|uniref:hypothetical protein n=1 Tax=unclassified Thioalkalivibrio TaxID=2621013 RepID=UPI00035D844F|nr:MULTISPECIES: hypothetical protein [unclassified Thioalkalivibrio]